MADRRGTPRKRKGHAGGTHSRRGHASHDHAANPGHRAANARRAGGGNRLAVTVLALILVAGLVVLGVFWVLAWG
ncbi:MAG: hypothetical protein MUE51_06990 [Thermoleophilia bacterium]|jgi:hypothetical protein|nr:hypothetical protein [Thermoleophilia bacterium]